MCRAVSPTPGPTGVGLFAGVPQMQCAFRESPTEVLVFDRDEWKRVVSFLTSTSAGAYSPLEDTVTTWRNLLYELGPGLDGTVIERTHKGRQYVIIKGRAGLREAIKGRWYRADNAAIVRLAIGKTGLARNLIRGTVITIVLVGVHDILDAVLSDDETVRALLGYTLAVDVSKAIVATVVSAIVTTVVAASALPVWIVVGGAIAVGVLASLALDRVAPTDVFAVRLQQLVDSVLSRPGEILTDLEYAVHRMIRQMSALGPGRLPGL